MEVEEVLALIEEIIEEHKLILHRVRTLDGAINDVSAMLELERAKEDFVPGRFGDQRRALEIWQESIEALDEGLQAHFDREEKGLLTAFEKYGDRMLASALHALLHEHEELRDRLTKSKVEMAELAAGGLSRGVWEGRVWGLRVYVSHTRNLLEAHAKSEQELLLTLRRQLEERKKGKD